MARSRPSETTRDCCRASYWASLCRRAVFAILLLTSGASHADGTGPILWAVGGFHGICGNARAVPSDGYGSYGAAEQAGLDAWLAYDPGCAQYFSPVVRSGTFPTYGVTSISAPWGFGVSAYCPERASQSLSESNRVCRYTSTASQDKQSGCRSCKRGNPVDPTIGNKFLSARDYEGSGPFPLRLTRAYNSLVTRPGAMGAKWVHSYQRAVFVDPDAQSVSLLRPDGSVLSFATSNGIDYLVDPDVPDRVVALRDTGGQITGWRYDVASGDEVELYSAQGRLLSVANRAGLTHTLSYTDGSGIPPNGGLIEGTGTPLPAGLLLRVSDTFGRSLAFGYDSKKRVVRVTDPAVANYRYAYDASSNIVSVTFPDNRVLTYHYNEPPLVIATSPRPNHLTGITDENGDRFADYGYDLFGRAILTAHRAGGSEVNRHQFAYNSGQYFPGNTTETDPLGAVRTHTFEAKHGRLLVNSITGAVCPSCGPRSQTFDANGYAASRTDWNGNVTQLERTDPYGRADLETRRIEGFGTPQQRTITTEWHPAYRLPTRVAEPLRVTTYVYGDPIDPNPGNRGSLLSKTVQATADATGSAGFAATPVGAPRAWTYTFNDDGQVLTMDGPRTDVADVTTYAYFPNDDPDLGKRGNIATITNALGQTTQITAYDAHGKPLTIVDPNGLTTTLAYDPRERLTSRTVGSETTSYEYDGVGQLTKVTLPDGSFLSYTYDTAHRLTAIQDNLGNRISYTLDLMGNRTREDVFDPASQLAQTRTRVYSNLNRLTQEIGGTNPVTQITSYAYDNQGNVTSITDPLNRVTVNAYDALNRMKQVTDPATGVTGYGYDGLDQLVSVSDPRSNTTGYTLDGLGNLAAQSSPDTGTTANTQDAAGNLITSTDATGQSTSYTYDALNRVTRIVYNQATGTQLKQLDYVYDQGANGIGRLTSITETSAASAVLLTMTYGYDPQGRIVNETRAIGGQTYATAYAYDAAGRMTGMTYPSGRMMSYGFDGLGRVNRIETTGASQTQVVVQDIAYHPFGAPKAFTFGNLQAYGRDFDLDGRIATHTLADQTKVLNIDAASRITGIAQQGNPANTNTYGYDALDRLTSAVLPTSTFGFGYDPVGNRLSKTIGGSTDAYTYGPTSNRLAAITGSSGTRTYVHDANGSITDDALNTFGYDARGRLVSAVSAAGATSYQVNALGQRVRKTSSLGDTVFHYDTQGRLLAESSASGAPLREYLWLGDLPVAVAVGATGSGQAGGRIAFIRGSAVYAINSDGSGLTPLTTPQGGEFDTGFVRASPDGTKLGFQRFDVNYNAQVWVMNADGTGQVRVSPAGAYSESFAWAPTGAKLAFIKDGQLATANADGSGLQQLTTSPNFAFRPSWSGDGAKIAFANALNMTAKSQVYRVNADGMGLVNLSASTTADFDPVFSPDGARIAFTRYPNQYLGWTGNLYVMSADGSGKLALTTTSDTYGAAWSPNGQQLAFTRKLGTAIDLFVVSAAGGGLTRLTAGLSIYGIPTWSADGARISFSANSEIYTVNADGTNLTNVTNAAAANNSFPAFLPGQAPPAQAQLHFVHADHLNTPRAVTNQAQQVVWRWENQEPFGKSLPEENPSGLGSFEFNLRFPGQYFDAETGLFYNYFRDYDPQTGRYVQSDPIGLAGGLNTYAYVDNDPLTDSDPYGLARNSWKYYRRVNCPEKERKECMEICEKQGRVMESCKITRGRRHTVRNGIVVPEIYTVPGSMSCKCKDCEEEGALQRFWDWLTRPRQKYDDPLAPYTGGKKPESPYGVPPPGRLPGFGLP